MGRNSGHEKAPVVGATEASDINAVIDQENDVMANNSTNVVPFNFGKHQVRTLLIAGEPWFVATDIAAALQYRDSFNMCRNLDDDEKGTQIVSTLGGAQEMLAINESGLYAAILRSRKQEAKLFKKWVTGEVLPAIRKTGRYDDQQAKMPTLIDELIGMSELSVIKGLIRDKGKAIAADKRQSFALTMHNRLHTRFNVPRTELIPAGQFEAACNFIAAYSVLEGEFIAKEQPRLQLPLNINYPIEAISCRRPDMLIDRGEGHAWLDVSLDDLRENFTSPCEMILSELTRAGYEVEGAWWELRTYRNKIYSFMSFAQGINRVAEDPKRYAIKTRAAA